MNTDARIAHPVRSLLALACLAIAGNTAAATEYFKDLSIDVVGEGRPVLMIPGLNSGADVWRETCAALQADQVQCHLVQLPGFAGLAPSDAAKGAFVDAMRDRLLDYVKARQLKQPVVVGHSLGGALALEMAIVAPDAVGPLVIVDSLTFFPARANPAATVETTSRWPKAFARRCARPMTRAHPSTRQFRLFIPKGTHDGHQGTRHRLCQLQEHHRADRSGGQSQGRDCKT